ncbi:hypothetical protein D3C72_731180 [compost metagenome]
MVRTQIDPGVRIDAGVARHVFTEIAVTTAARVETGIAVVITQLQAAAVFSDAPPAFAGIFVFQPHVR